MSYFDEMQRLRGRQDNRTRQAQFNLNQLYAPSNAEIAVQAGQEVLGRYTDLLSRAQAKKQAQAQAEAKAEAKKQALIDKRKEMLYGKILDRGGELPEEFAGMPEGYQLPPKPVKPVVRTVHNPSGFYFIEQNPETQEIKVQKAPGVEGKKISSTLAYYMARDEDRADVDAAEREYKTGMDSFKAKQEQYNKKWYNKALGRINKNAPPPPTPPDWSVILARHPNAAKLSKATDYNVDIFNEKPAQQKTTFDLD